MRGTGYTGNLGAKFAFIDPRTQTVRPSRVREDFSEKGGERGRTIRLISILGGELHVSVVIQWPIHGTRRKREPSTKSGVTFPGWKRESNVMRLFTPTVGYHYFDPGGGWGLNKVCRLG